MARRGQGWLEVLTALVALALLAASLTFSVMLLQGTEPIAMGVAGACAASGAVLTLLVLRHWRPAAILAALLAVALGGVWAYLSAVPTAKAPVASAVATMSLGKPAPAGSLLSPLGVTPWAGGVIPVCWTAPPDAANAELFAAVDEAQTAWSRVAHVRFNNLGVCPSGTGAVRLSAVFSGEDPDTQRLGSPAPGQADQVNLAFTFASRRTCSRGEDPVIRRACVYGVAVHEFGHVLGLPDVAYSRDAPESCLLRGDHPRLPIPYDPRSVMNACNDAHYFGRLSDADIAGARALYGPPSN